MIEGGIPFSSVLFDLKCNQTGHRERNADWVIASDTVFYDTLLFKELQIVMLWNINTLEQT